MRWKGEIERLMRGLRALGVRKLSAIGGALAAGCLAIVVAGYYLSRPQFEVLYAGLETQDAARVASTLREAAVNFDLSADGGSVLVETGSAPRVRMLLAEKGLPRSGNAGYELYDKAGSLGLTSFMQDVTRTRVLEGELARSILTIHGVRAARVHLVLPEEAGFRRRKQSSSASVIVKYTGPDGVSVGQAIRRLVAAGAPGMAMEAVTVMNSDGAVLASGGDGEEGEALWKSATLERTVSDGLQENVRRALAPILGLRGFNVSVAVRLNTDRRQTSETVYNPESRVERSIRTIKESQSSSGGTGPAPTSVERNIPGDRARGEGKTGGEDTQKKEELTNFEVSSKSTSTVSRGYAVERISVALSLDRAAIEGKGGGSDREKRVQEISQLASAAVAFNRERGDTIAVVVSDFAGDMTEDAAAATTPTWRDALARHAGSFVNALALLGVVALVVAFGLRPLARSVGLAAEAATTVASAEPAPIALPSSDPAPEAAEPTATESSRRRIEQRKLAQLVLSDETEVAGVLRDWIRASA